MILPEGMNGWCSSILGRTIPSLPFFCSSLHHALSSPHHSCLSLSSSCFTCFVSHSLRLFWDRPLPLPDLFSCKEHDFWESYFIFFWSPCGLAWMHIFRELCCTDCREGIKLLIDHSLSGQREKMQINTVLPQLPARTSDSDSLAFWSPS